MGNKHEGKGIFAPLVVLARNILGKKEFNQLRGKGIALHSQVHTHLLSTLSHHASSGLFSILKHAHEGTLNLLLVI